MAAEHSNTVAARAHHDEAHRLAALDDYDILDSPPEPQFDRVVRIAAHVFHAPISLISLVASSRQWFKARVGLEAAETPRSMSFCSHAIRGTGVFVVEDAASHEDFRTNPLVLGEPNIRFYAGAPLRTRQGPALGTLCVIDRLPRAITQEEEQVLSDLAAIVVDELDIRRINRRLNDLETTDPLTGLANRRSFFASANKEFTRTRRYGRPFSTMIVDIDHFRRLNDAFGHDAGDHALMALADAMTRGQRSETLVGRIGGEEFAMLLPETDITAARMVAERLRQAAAALEIETDTVPCPFTISIGLTALGPKDPDYKTALARADQALYTAKEGGRNRVALRLPVSD